MPLEVDLLQHHYLFHEHTGGVWCSYSLLLLLSSIGTCLQLTPSHSRYAYTDYRIWWIHSWNSFLTTYYDPFYGDLYLYPTEPEPLHAQGRWSSLIIRVWQDEGIVASVLRLFDVILFAVRRGIWNMLGESQDSTHAVSWPPTWILMWIYYLLIDLFTGVISFFLLVYTDSLSRLIFFCPVFVCFYVVTCTHMYCIIRMMIYFLEN